MDNNDFGMTEGRIEIAAGSVRAILQHEWKLSFELTCRLYQTITEQYL